MRLLNFIMGVLGVVLIIGAFSSFLPLVFLGGLFTGNLIFAFVFPIFLIIIGAAMVYFGFYYKESYTKSNLKVIEIFKWGIIASIAVLIGDYLIDQLIISNIFLTILFMALIISVIIQAVMHLNHEHNFRFNWFLFYFLVYCYVVWLMGDYILPKFFITSNYLSSVVLGFTIAGVMLVFQKMKIRSKSLPWFSLILALLLIVAHLSSLPNITDFKNIINKDIPAQNSLELSEGFQSCPIPSTYPVYEGEISPATVGPLLKRLVDDSIWKVENDFSVCYKGKYKGQYPNWVYCDNFIVSRWEKNKLGTIDYRWYTAVTAEWKPVTNSKNPDYYSLAGFVCENGQKVTVEKGVTNYYVYDTKDGKQIKIKY